MYDTEQIRGGGGGGAYLCDIEVSGGRGEGGYVYDTEQIRGGGGRICTILR